MDTSPRADGLKVFVPSQDFEQSLAFYRALGCRCLWQIEGLAELQWQSSGFYLQKFYLKDFAENLMMALDVDDAQAWYEHVQSVLESNDYSSARVQAPKLEAHGSKVTYVWDPCGVLWHFSERLPKS